MIKSKRAIEAEPKKPVFEPSIIFTGDPADYKLTPEEAERVRRVFEAIKDQLAADEGP